MPVRARIATLACKIAMSWKVAGYHPRHELRGMAASRTVGQGFCDESDFARLGRMNILTSHERSHITMEVPCPFSHPGQHGRMGPIQHIHPLQAQ